MEEISMIAEPSTTQRLNKKRVKNIHGGESDNLWENVRYMGAHVPGSGISWSRPFWETILIFYWVPSLSSCSLSASKPAALEAGCFLEETNTLSKTDKQLHQKDLLPRTWHIDTGYNRTAQFCCV